MIPILAENCESDIHSIMKKLFVYLTEYRRESILGPFFKLLEALFELLTPMIIAALIDTGIANGNRAYIVRQCLILVALGLVGMICSITAQYFAAKAAVGFTNKVRHALYDHIQKLSYADLDALSAPTLITRLTNDMNLVQTGVNLTLRLLLRSPCVVVGAFIMSLLIDVRISLIFAATILTLTLIVTVVLRICIPLYRKTQTSLDSVMGMAKENLGGTRVIRAFAMEPREQENFKSRTDHLAKLQQHVGRISTLMNPLTYIVINIGIILLIRAGAIRVEAGLLTQGAVVALYNYMSQILVELLKLATLIISVARAVASGNRISAILEVPPSLEGGDKAFAPGHDGALVAFTDVSLRYPGAAADAVSGLDFSVRKGETVGIIGGTGSGKSSIINLLLRFYDATGGRVLIGGIDCRDYSIDNLRGLFGIAPQQASLFHGSIRDNIRWGKKDATDEEIWQALKTAQAADFVSQTGDGLDHIIQQGSKNLSGGQRQRLTIARALVRRPVILILDDSSSALDYATDAALRSALLQQSSDMTVFIVSQRASSILHADRILVLDNGSIIGNGTHQALLDTCPVYREIYETQFPKEGV